MQKARPKLHRKHDPGMREFERAKRQARDKEGTIRRTSPRLYREPKP